ncbi:hypothetical protein EUAN_06970 [Andreesenia angusta]|uniref:Uncharacterized protein n=1 Tax=Andreesenia angusta TaxID=39480 RepID=A0A1S1V8I4_9FIRM|nr:hypothetical protein [Andreesenia angusta]OHW62913.1 hypothetical protein EUAN_06970 [Andreesenia angusta]
MKIKALKSFAGKVTMTAGQELNVEDKEMAEDLVNAGFAEEIKVAAKGKA